MCAVRLVCPLMNGSLCLDFRQLANELLHISLKLLTRSITTRRGNILQVERA